MATAENQKRELIALAASLHNERERDSTLRR